jgi:hypothetical protein
MTGPFLEADVTWKVWIGGVISLALAGSLCLVSPRLGGIALILFALGALAAFAFRFL